MKVTYFQDASHCYKKTHVTRLDGFSNKTRLELPPGKQKK
jgi:hypothetical protein